MPYARRTSGGGNLHSPGPIGDVTPSTGAFTTLSAVVGSAGVVINVNGVGEIDCGAILGNTGAIGNSAWGFYLDGNSGNIVSRDTGIIGFASGAATLTVDVRLVRAAANALALRNGSAEQTLIVGPASTGIRSNAGELEAFDNAGEASLLTACPFMGAFTVETLPTPSSAFATAFITNADAATVFGSAASAANGSGLGLTKYPVYWEGVTWYVG